MKFKPRVSWTSTLAWLALAPLVCNGASGRLSSTLFERVSQSSDATSTNNAARAVDGANFTASLTKNLPGSYWTAALGRPYPLERIELLNRAAPNDKELEGLTLRLFNIDDQIVFETPLTNPGPAETLVLNPPSGLLARSVWIGLNGSQTNGGGNHRVGLAELRLFGNISMPFGPEPVSSPPTSTVQASQSSDYSATFPASNALDGDAATFTHTANQTDSYWGLDLGKPYRIDRVELVNRADCCAARLGGLVLRILDSTSNAVATATVTNPGLGGLWSYAAPAGTVGRYLRVGLEKGEKNADGNYYVTLAEARVYSGVTNLVNTANASAPVTNNLASFKRCYMVRLTPSLPPASNANDDNYFTEVKTTTQTVDGYWETDLGASFALYGVRTIAANGIGNRLTNTMLRLYNDAHESVFEARLNGKPDVFDSDLNGPVFARYVRVGLENKQRTDPGGGLEWHIGMREIEVFGRPTNEVGILAFACSAQRVNSGQPVTLSWTVQDVRRVEIYPAIGSVGACTAVSGQGSLTLTPTNSVEYTLTASNAAGLFIRSVAIEVDGTPLPVRISEIVADNQYSLRDGFKEAPDWIEIRNPGNTTVNLAGYGLSDAPAQPMKWLFPSTNIPPHSFMVVFASGRDTPFDPAGGLHANFRLNRGGGSFLLTAPDGKTTLDSVGYPALDTDLAYGRNLEGQWGFLEPTPGGINAAPAYSGWLGPLSFSHTRGFYNSAFTLTLANSNPGATIFYSLDGSVPSIPYTGGINVSATKAVRAQVRRTGYRPPRIQTQTYVFINNVIASSVMRTTITQNPLYAPRMRPGLLALPSVSIVLPGLLGYEEKEGSVEVLWPDGAQPAQVNCGISTFGGSWQSFAKASFRMKCRASYGAAKLDAPLFNGFDRGVLARTSFDEIEFRAGNQDMIDRGFYMAGRFVEDSMLDMGSLNPHGRFVHVYFNGVYGGQYDAREPLVEHFLADYLGGSPEQYVNVRGNDNVGDNFVVGAPEPPNVQAWERVLSLKNSYAGVRPYLDVSHLIDFMLLWLYGDCESEFRAGGPLDAGTGFKFWIADADGFLRTSALGLDRTGNPGPGGLFGGLVAGGNSDFKILLADRIYRHCFNDGALTPARNHGRLAARMREIHDSLLAECARWGYRTPSNWESAAALIRSNLFPARTAELVAQLRARGLYPSLDPPTISPYGGMVTNGCQPQLSSTSGTVYYTLDGSDPRRPGGGISPSALVWKAGAFTITQDVTVQARVRATGGVWSALAQPRFLLASRRAPSATELLITEIHYHPAASDDLEFIELWNAGTNLLDLSGVTLTNAIRFIFPASYAIAPGAFVVVAKNAPAFARCFQDSASPWYWPGINVAGEWAGNLSNEGDRVSLVASNGLELCSVPYKTGGSWPERAKGRGSSLELASPPSPTANDDEVRAFIADGHNWAASSLYQGSPGRFDSFVKSVGINEVMSNPASGDDWVELFNGGLQTLDLTGCALTDQHDPPRYWTFPPGASLPPGQFMVIASTRLGFGFDKQGDRAVLLQMSGSNVVRFLDAADFPAADIDVPFGFFKRSDGVLNLTELRSKTPGAVNALPQVGPVVISEIMNLPAPGMAQFIELANITDAPIPLFDSARPTNAWKLEGIGDFVFPRGIVLPPCSTLIVSSTNPAHFQTQYGLSTSVPVFGPWPGTLSTNGESLKLLRPGAPESNGTVPFYRVDHVDFRAITPWPQAAAGFSLERMPLTGYGNDPGSWQTGPTNGSPGAIPGKQPPVWISQPDLVFPIGLPWEIPLTVSNPNCPPLPLRFEVFGLPLGFWFDTNSVKIAGTGSIPGAYPITITASDDSAPPLMATNPFMIRLTDNFELKVQGLPDRIRLTIPVIAGEHYAVEYSDSVAPADWRLFKEIANAPDNWVQVIEAPLEVSARFYRVRWKR